MADTQNTHASPPQYLFYRRLVAYTVYTICGLLFLWSVASVTIQTFYPEYRPPAVKKTVVPKGGASVTADVGVKNPSPDSHGTTGKAQPHKLPSANSAMGTTAPPVTAP